MPANPPTPSAEAMAESLGLHGYACNCAVLAKHGKARCYTCRLALALDAARDAGLRAGLERVLSDAKAIHDLPAYLRALIAAIDAQKEAPR